VKTNGGKGDHVGPCPGSLLRVREQQKNFQNSCVSWRVLLVENGYYDISLSNILKIYRKNSMSSDLFWAGILKVAIQYRE
jgi:hypothetical protein